MTDDHHHETGSMVAREQAPEHGPDFWTELDSSMGSETAELPAATDRATHMASVNQAAAAPTGGSATLESSRRVWPLAAAAAALVIVGLGFLVAQRSSDPAATTEVVAGTTETVDAVPLDGPEGETDEPSEDTVTASTQTDDDAGTSDSAEADTSSSAGSAVTGAASAAADPTPTATFAIPDFARAPGASGDPEYLPLDQGLPTDATFLANWPQRALSWYGVADSNTTCANANYSEIRYVNGSGLTQLVRDPQLRFSGEISHFTVHNDQNLAAWISSCGTQLELYVANLTPAGQVIDMTLAWLGEGSIRAALVLWDANEVNLNAIEPGGTAFAIAYNIETKTLGRNGGPSRIILEAGAPSDRSLTPLAATPDGGITYFAGEAPAGTVSDCIALYGSGRSDTLWLRQGEGQWQPAVTNNFPMATVTAAAIEPESFQFAFADVCADEVGRVVIGAQLPDGRISVTSEIDLAPYVPGYADQLFWVDSQTLRIETENSFGTVRLDYRIDEGIIVLLD